MQGPAEPLLVVAGIFNSAGSTAASGIVAYDIQTGSWSPLGTGLSSLSGAKKVTSLASMPNGKLVAGGTFSIAGGVTAQGIAQWDGSTWSPLGAGLINPLQGGGSTTNALAVLQNGDLVAGGDFTSAGGAPASFLARWDGTNWSEIGGGTNGYVRALCVLPNGDLIVGGDFTSVGGTPANRIARWNGTSWSQLGAGLNSGANAITALPNGDIVAAGNFTTAGGAPANRVARWDGSTWAPLGSGMSSVVLDLATLPTGQVIAAGGFTSAGGVPARRIAIWNGFAWSPMGNGMDSTVDDVTVLSNTEIIAGGLFQTAGDAGAKFIARWNGIAWTPLGSGFTSYVRALAVQPNGDLVAGGDFDGAGGTAVNRIARWNGSTWSILGSGVDNQVRALATLQNGHLVAGGRFQTAGGVSAKCIARWDGSNWSALGSGMAGFSLPEVSALAVLPNGDLVAGGLFDFAGGVSASCIALWDGSSWSSIGDITAIAEQPTVDALAVLPNGDLVVGGRFNGAGGVPVNHIARWNGSTWSAMGNGFSGTTITKVRAFLVQPGGDLIAAGSFTAAAGLPASSIARWNGSAWSAIGGGLSYPGTFELVYASSLAALPNGDFVAGGFFSTAGSSASSNIARWNGVDWSPLGSGLDGNVEALAMLPTGEIAAGGFFQKAGGLPSPFFARYATPCPASVSQSGSGCASSGGANTYSALTLPWIGSTYRTRGTGLPALALVGAVSGLTPTVLPLSSLLPPAPAGCSLLATPDLVQIQVTSTGTVDEQLTLANKPGLVGLTFYQQLVVLELDANLSVVQTTSSNRLTATIGSF